MDTAIEILKVFSRIALFTMDAILLLSGVAVALLVIWMIYDASVKLIFWPRANGTVTGFDREEGCYFPLVTYVSRGGEKITARSASGRGVRGCRKNDMVRIVVNPRDPTQMELLKFSNFAIPLLIVGAIAAAFAFGTWYKWSGLFSGDF